MLHWTLKDKQTDKPVFHKLPLMLQDIDQDTKITTIKCESEFLTLTFKLTSSIMARLNFIAVYNTYLISSKLTLISQLLT